MMVVSPFTPLHNLHGPSEPSSRYATGISVVVVGGLCVSAVALALILDRQKSTGTRRKR